jgi:hypothetical protein
LTLIRSAAKPAKAHHKKGILADSFYSSIWLGQIKQALTIHKEDTNQRLREFNPEEQLT